MHWEAHGQTAAEVVYRRADASKPNMGPTTWAGDKPRKTDVSIAKNYLAQDEIKALNLIILAYLDFAELQAMSLKPMYIANWIARRFKLVATRRMSLDYLAECFRSRPCWQFSEQLI
jgi:hypothetical protein